MTQNLPANRLYLLVPWDLPIELQLSESDKTKLCKALQQLLQASEQTSHQEALTTVNQALEILGITDVFPVQVPLTNTPLKGWEVEDYDNYFGVEHVQTQESAICLVRSVLVAYQTFLALNHHSSQFNPAQVELQKRGFESYAHLLARAFNLSLEETYD